MDGSLKSSVEDMGEIVTKIYTFKGGNKKTIKGVITKSVVQSEFTRFDTTDGRRVYVNTKNIDMFEVFKEK